MFAVYVNHPRDIAMIHRIRCQHFENRKDNTENGYWRYNFDTFEIARDFAQNTGKRTVRRCLKRF